MGIPLDYFLFEHFMSCDSLLRARFCTLKYLRRENRQQKDITSDKERKPNLPPMSSVVVGNAIHRKVAGSRRFL